MTCHKVHTPKANVDRLSLAGRNGSKGLIQFELSDKTKIICLKTYLEATPDWMLQLENFHKKCKKRCTPFIKKAINNDTERTNAVKILINKKNISG